MTDSFTLLTQAEAMSLAGQLRWLAGRLDHLNVKMANLGVEKLLVPSDDLDIEAIRKLTSAARAAVDWGE